MKFSSRTFILLSSLIPAIAYVVFGHLVGPEHHGVYVIDGRTTLIRGRSFTMLLLFGGTLYGSLIGLANYCLLQIPSLTQTNKRIALTFFILPILLSFLILVIEDDWYDIQFELVVLASYVVVATFSAVGLVKHRSVRETKP